MMLSSLVTGPSGLTAAIFTARANIKTLLVEKDSPGGQMVTEAIEIILAMQPF
jgi:thioredoxin reductase